MHLSLQRIAADIQMCRDQQLDANDHIYISPDPSNAYIVYAMILGPTETPYQDGYYFFHVQFPQNYPFAPPVVKLMTKGYYVRMHPNFYVNGKVCLSILNTWKGPQWTSCQNLRSVLLSLQALMNENPLVNEPGWEINVNRTQHKTYRQIVASENVRTAILTMLQTPPKSFEVFLPTMRTLFVANYDRIAANLTTIQPAVARKEYACTVYNMQVKYNYTDLARAIECTRKQLDGGTDDTEEKVSSQIPSSATKRRVPTQSARDHHAAYGDQPVEHENAHFQAYADARGYFRWRRIST